MEFQISSFNVLLIEAFKDMQEAWKMRTVIPGIDTGFARFDEIMAGLHSQELTILTSKPGTGKTTFALNLALQASLRGHGALFISLETHKKKLVRRVLTSLGYGPTIHLEKGQPYTSDLEALKASVLTLNDHDNFRLYSANNLTLASLKALIKTGNSETPMQLVVVDYLTLLKTDSSGGSRRKQIAEIGLFLKQLAFEWNLHILALCPMVTYSSRGIPRLPESGASRSLEYDADNIFVLRGYEYDDPEAEYWQLSLDIVKHRHGPLGAIPLRLYPASGKVEEDDQA